jgi:hypothetical protein
MRWTRRALFGAGAALLWGLPSAALARPERNLFVITRSKNANVVHYDVRTRANGQLELEDPVGAYWILAAEDGRREDLTWFETRFAYGFRLTSRPTKLGFRMRIAAFDEQDIVVRRHRDGRYRAHFTIAGRDAVLERIHVQTREGGLTPKVVHVDLVGRASAGGARITERRRPL